MRIVRGRDLRMVSRITMVLVCVFNWLLFILALKRGDNASGRVYYGIVLGVMGGLIIYECPHFAIMAYKALSKSCKCFNLCRENTCSLSPTNNWFIDDLDDGYEDDCDN